MHKYEDGDARDFCDHHFGNLQRLLGYDGFPPGLSSYSDLKYTICHIDKKNKTMKAPLFPMEASEKGASGSQISPGETNNRFRSFFKKDQTASSRVSPCEEETECFLLLALGTFRLGSSEIKRESDLFHKGPKRVIKDHMRLSLFSFQYWEFFSSELFPPPSSFRSW